MDKIDELLTRGVENIYPSKEALEKVLRSGKKLRLYLGVDPSSEELHIGHTVPLRKLQQFQNLGHHVILLIGDFTGMIGDPTDKTATRKQMTHKEVLTNAKTYKEQAAKVFRFEGENPVEIKYNSTWLAKLSFKEIIELASNFTVQQMLERDMFQERMKSSKPVHLHEFFYPLMQGYDSVAMDVDLEVGGKDQTFNMLTGRTLMAVLKKKEKFVLTVPLLTDSKGQKIGKTEGNAIAISGKPEILYAQIMSLGDDAIFPVFNLATNVPISEIEKMKHDLKSGINPMDLKKKLAWTIVAMYNSLQEADRAQIEFENTSQRGKVPRNIDLTVSENLHVLEALVRTGLAKSRSEAKRLIREKAVEVDNEIVRNIEFPLKGHQLMKSGKRNFVKIKEGIN
jgi:tyrosyl-tRNA synthetase